MMVKATLRSAVLLGALAASLLVASVPGFAEVQNVRVGGDVTVRAIHRENMDLNSESNEAVPAVTDYDSEDDFFMQTSGLNIGADLTENVSAFVRIVSERDWNAHTETSAGGGAKGGGEDISLSQAYVTLKELFYSPLTLRVGTQPIVWGRGLVLGSNLLPSLLGTAAGESGDRQGALAADEYTDFTAFDAIRATLDLSGVGNIPASLDYVYIKADENLTGTPDDVNIQGANLSFNLDDWNAEVETYFLNKRDKSGAIAIAPIVKNGSINTLGMRGSVQPVEGASVYGEIAYQWGKRNVSLDDPGALRPAGSTQQGWLINLGTDYTLADVAATPKIGAEWILTTGDDNDAAFAGWEAIAPGYFPTLIRSYQMRSTVLGLYPYDQPGVTSSFTNQHELALYGSFNPLEDLTVGQRFSVFIADVGVLVPGAGERERNSHFGTEWDTRITYDYTEDVQFGVDYGLFLPGDVFRDTINVGAASGNDSKAQKLVTTVSLKF